MSPCLSLLAHACHHSNGPGLMSEATTGGPALKGISAEGLLARKASGEKFWAVPPSYNQQPCRGKEVDQWLFSWLSLMWWIRTKRGGTASAALSPLLQSWVKTSRQSFYFFLFSKTCCFDHIDIFCANCSVLAHCLHLGLANHFTSIQLKCVLLALVWFLHICV